MIGSDRAGEEREVTARGLPAELWRPLLTSRPEPELALGQLADGASVTIVVPHPDDETLGAGGLLHRLGLMGAQLRAIFVTDGAAGYPGCSTEEATQLALIRRTEAQDALTALGLNDPQVRFLNVPDGSVSTVEADLSRELTQLLADSTLCLAPWLDDPHPDHQAVGRAAHTAAALTGVELWQYPIWMRHSIRPDDPLVAIDRLRVLRLSAAETAAKHAAIQTHASQLRSPFTGYGPVLPAQVLELFADGLEPFFLAEGAAR